MRKFIMYTCIEEFEATNVMDFVKLFVDRKDVLNSTWEWTFDDLKTAMKYANDISVSIKASRSNTVKAEIMWIEDCEVTSDEIGFDVTEVYDCFVAGKFPDSFVVGNNVYVQTDDYGVYEVEEVL